ncbi:MAG: dipeptide/oligopeptide/nickel ABC transporter ATP-binding protein [Lachnospiraceae bacterium]|nr:dipeptide/oligopeptide/nickel ABC transporter ATP-binding protein [Lachnospiraceae bacterium]
MDGKVLEVKNLSVGYKVNKVNFAKGKREEILSDVSFQIREGEMVGLLGASGSGKTTLCKCILGLLKEYQGEIIHFTENPQMIFQDPYSSLNPKKKIGWILEEPLKIRGIKKEERKERLRAVLEKVRLPLQIADRYPKELSGGQRQRVSLSLALMTGAKFILADEPLSALDVTVQAQMIDLLQELQEKEKLSYLFVSHDLDVVGMLCKRVLVIREGALKEYEI